MSGDIISEHVFQITILSTKYGAVIMREKIDKIFQPYFKDGQRGYQTHTGLGLSIVKRLVEKHGGRIWAESPSDGGAAFTFSLPKI